MQNHRFAAIDQGTTSTRIAVFDNNGAFQTDCSRMSISHKQITPKTGWVEHDAEEILANIKKCIASLTNQYTGKK